MTKVVKNLKPTTDADFLIHEIKKVCIANPQNEIAAQIKYMIDATDIPKQMDKDLLRRLSDPACNPLDENFNMPHSLLQLQLTTI